MKRFIIIVMLIPTICTAQKYALINKNLKYPILYTDSVSLEQVRKGYLPIETTVIDTFLANIDYISKLVMIPERAKFQSMDLRNGTTVIHIKRIPKAYGDRYEVKATTQANEVLAVEIFCDTNTPEKKTKKYLKEMIEYVRNERSLFKEYKAISPKFYNVVVETE